MSCECPKGGFIQDPDCVPCSKRDPHCTKCSLQGSRFTCEACQLKKIPVEVNREKKCHENCLAQKKQFDFDGSCIDCQKFAINNVCSKCSSKVGCLECQDGRRMIINDAGMKVCTKCSEKQGIDLRSMGRTNCFDCFDNPIRVCDKCTDMTDLNPFSKCIECRNGYTMASEITTKDQVQCIQPVREDECPVVPFQSPYRKCSTIDPHCVRCFWSQCVKLNGMRYKCEQCKDGFKPAQDPKFNYGCLRLCGPGKMRLEKDNSCMVCEERIQGCFDCQEDEGEPRCTKCLDNYRLRGSMPDLKETKIPGKQCIRVCAVNEALTNENTCIPCSKAVTNCLRCVGPPPPYKCIECTEGFITRVEAEEKGLAFIPESVVCVKECTETQVLTAENKCEECSASIPNCHTCSGPDPIKCTKCQSPYLLRSEALDKGIYLIPGVECHRDCPRGQTITTKNTCARCGDKVPNCVECYGPTRFRCTKCESGFLTTTEVIQRHMVPIEGLECTRSCPEGSGVSPKNTCVECSESIQNCLKCQGGAHFRCTECRKPYLSFLEANDKGIYQPRGHQCFKNCKKGQGLSTQNLCVDCYSKVENCAECKGVIKTYLAAGDARKGTFWPKITQIEKKFLYQKIGFVSRSATPKAS